MTWSPIRNLVCILRRRHSWVCNHPQLGHVLDFCQYCGSFRVCPRFKD